MIESIKDLEKLLKLCRKQGVTEITLDKVSFKLGDLPQTSNNALIQDEDPENPYAGFPTGELTPEQLAFYSSGGLPKDDPALQGEPT